MKRENVISDERRSSTVRHLLPNQKKGTLKHTKKIAPIWSPNTHQSLFTAMWNCIKLAKNLKLSELKKLWPSINCIRSNIGYRSNIYHRIVNNKNVFIRIFFLSSENRRSHSKIEINQTDRRSLFECLDTVVKISAINLCLICI